MMLLLDTHVLSELMRPTPDASVLAWINAQPAQDLYLCAVVVAELLYGVARLPLGQRRTRLAQAMQTTLEEDFSQRILPFDLEAATAYAHLVAIQEARGRPMAIADAQIAAIGLTHAAALVTRNTPDFENLGLPLINPWISPPIPQKN